MVDPAALSALVGPVVGTALAYLQKHAAGKVVDKALESVGEAAGKGTASLGARALEALRGWFTRSGDQKAQVALTAAEHDPADADYRAKLEKETARVAAADPGIREELEVLAREVTLASGNASARDQAQAVVLNNSGVNTGVQGLFNGPVNIGAPPRP